MHFSPMFYFEGIVNGFYSIKYFYSIYFFQLNFAQPRDEFDFLLYKARFVDFSVFLDQKMSVVGFIGLGNMGGHMARNLLRNGVKLIVNDTDTKRMQELKVGF